MYKFKIVANKYINWVDDLGRVPLSIYIATLLTVIMTLIQLSARAFLHVPRDVHYIWVEFFYNGIFILIINLFFAHFIQKLANSRREVMQRVRELERLKAKDKKLNSQLRRNLRQLDQKLQEKEKAEGEKYDEITDLEEEVYQREKTQLELAERTALLRSFIDASPDMIFYRNEKGQFLNTNRAMEALVGKSASEMRGLRIEDIYSTDIASKISTADSQVYKYNVQVNSELWMEDHLGRKRYIEFRKLPLFGKKGRRMGIVGFGRDLTERKLTQDKIEQASREKTQFVSTISHELRTPLNGIVGLSQMLLDTLLTQEQRSHIRTIQISAVTLGNIFNDIIDMDKFDRRKFEIQPTALNFQDFITELEQLAALMAEQKGLNFTLDRMSELPDYIEADGTRLRQVLWNLLGNAVKFTRDGDIWFRVSAEIIGKNAELEFEIEDSGIGIKEDDIEKIFAMYYQVESEDKQQAGGTGIGLAVSKMLIEKMGGDIRVDSDYGLGTCFVITLSVPLSDSIEDEVVMEKSNTSLSILLVEDVELNIIVAKSLLESLGHNVSVAKNGKDALDTYRGGSFDLVLLDIQLPDMTGFDIAKILRETEKDLPPLIALTANVIKDKEEYKSQGMTDVLSKPINMKSVTQAIAHYCLGENSVELKDNSLDKDIDTSELNNILDIEMLNSFIEIVDKKTVLDGLNMFSNIMPEYMEELNASLVAKDQKNIVEHAHKIKGAAGSVGLKRIQELAQKAQSPDLPAWWENVYDWIEEMQVQYKNDIEELRKWLS